MALPPLRTQFNIDPAAAEQNALRTMAGRAGNILAQKRMAAYDVDRANMLADRAYQISRRPVLEAAEGLQVLRHLAPQMNMNMYLANRQRIMEATGLPQEFLPTAEQIQANAAQGGETPEQSFESLKAAWSGQEEPTPEEPKPPGWSAPKEGIDDSGNPIVYRVNKETGEPQIIKGVRPKTKGGLRVYDPKTGALLVDTTGAGTAPEFTRKTEGMIESKMAAGSEQLARMQQIYSEFRPEFQQLQTRFRAALTGAVAFLGGEVDEADRQMLVEFKAFQRKAIENINLYIKELTGAQMSEKEADRLRLAQPDPGERWWKGDDPITFKSKMDDVLRTTRAAVARWRYYKSKGFGDSKIRGMINDGSALSLAEMASRI